MKRNIYLVRHGESEANVGIFKSKNNTHNGPEKIKLTKTGKQQAKDLAKKVSKASKIFVSKYTRTHDTAKPLAKKFTKGKFTVSKHIHEFTYMNFGASKGKDIEELKKIAVGFWDILDPHLKIGKKSESFKEFIERLQLFVKSFEKFPDHTYIFSHKNVILTLLILLNEFPHKIDKKFTDNELKLFMEKLKEKRNNVDIKNTEIIDLDNL